MVLQDADYMLRSKSLEVLASLGILKPDSKYLMDKILLYFMDVSLCHLYIRISLTIQLQAERIGIEDSLKLNTSVGNTAINRSLSEISKDHGGYLNPGATLGAQLGNKLRSSHRLATAAPQIVQSPAALDMRNNIMAWLRKILRRYLIKITKDTEMNKKLRELNDSGIIEKGKKTDKHDEDDEDDFEEKEKLKPEPLARRGSEFGLRNSRNGRRSSVAVKAVKAPSRRGSMAPVRPMSPRLTLSVRPSSPTIREEEDEEHIEGDGTKTITIKPEPDISAEAPKVLQATLNDCSRSLTNLYLYVQVSETAANDGEKHKSPVTILQNPALSDFVTVINFYIDFQERRAERAEQERLEKIARELRAADEARLERERQQALQEYMRKKEQERLAKAAQRKERIASLRHGNNGEELPLIKRSKRVGNFTGDTHRSHCHASRETMHLSMYLV
jgi:hypothetical protein